MSAFRSLFLLLVVTLVAACESMPQLPQPAQVDGHHWVGTWAASPMESSGSAFSSAPSFENQTIRQIVHGSIGGTAVRVRVSNDFGSRNLELGAASVGLQQSGADIRPGTLRTLTFSGEESISIPAGAYVLSDPVELVSQDFSNYVVSLYFPQDTGAATIHSAGLQTSYVSDAGDFTASTGFPVQGTTESIFFLSGVEVAATRGAGVLVTFGDSITDGTGSTADTNQRWPNLLGQRLAAQGRLNIGILNQGIAGNRVLHDMIGENALARFERDVMSWPNLSHVVVMLGINDIGFSEIANFPFGDEVDNSPISAEQLIAAHRQLIARAKSRGVKIYGATLTPFGGAGYFSEAGEAKRQAVNTWIRESGEYDGVIDFDQALRDPLEPTRMREDLHAGDWLHPNDTGYAVMASVINLAVFGP